MIQQHIDRINREAYEKGIHKLFDYTCSCMGYYLGYSAYGYAVKDDHTGFIHHFKTPGEAIGFYENKIKYQEELKN